MKYLFTWTPLDEAVCAGCCGTAGVDLAFSTHMPGWGAAFFLVGLALFVHANRRADRRR